MPVLVGLFFGSAVIRIGLSRAMLTLVLWAAVWGAAEDLGERGLGPGAG